MIISETYGSHELPDEIDQQLQIPGHVLGATRVDDPKTYFDNLPITEEEDFGNRFDFGSFGLEVKS